MVRLSFKDRWIYSLYSWWGSFGAESFNLTDIVDKSVRLLILLPSNIDDARTASPIIPDLVSSLKAEAVFVVGESQAIECLNPSERIRVIPLDESSRMWPGMPSRKIVKRLLIEDINFAIDLNPHTEILPSLLCLRSQAAIRLCLDDPYRALFFNIRIQIMNSQIGNAKKGEWFDTKLSNKTIIEGNAPTSSMQYKRMLHVIQQSVTSSSHQSKRTTTLNTKPPIPLLYQRLLRAIKHKSYSLTNPGNST